MTQSHTEHPISRISALQITSAAEAAGRAIPPAFPLAATVAVNPFLGQSAHSLEHTSALLQRVAGCSATAPRAWFAIRLASGDITHADIADAIAAAGLSWSVAYVLKAAQTPRTPVAALSTVADLAAGQEGGDWPAHAESRIAAWAAGYFDQGQALWSASGTTDAFANWQSFATHDAVPGITGLRGLAAWFAGQPAAASDALETAVGALNLAPEALEVYFHRLLMGLGGWAQAARYRLWQAELAGESDTTLTELLTIRVVWDAGLLAQRADLAPAWDAAKARFAGPVVPSDDDRIDALLQDAAERAAQRGLAAGFAASPAATCDPAGRPAMQAAFCIDVRSEVMRRALESLSPEIATLGFAGFFGLTVAHTPAGTCDAEARLPVLLSAGLASRAEGDHVAARIAARATRAWGRFRRAAVSSFAFVEASGPLYAGKLVRDTLGLSEAAVRPAKPVFDPPLPEAAQVDAAETILNAMSLRGGFAPVVVIAGHGAHVTNNAHSSALQCGACGGFGGDVNARLLADVLNQNFVRTGLVARGIVVPADTIFVAALHDTGQDAITLYTEDLAPGMKAAARQALAQAQAWCEAAGSIARTERMPTLPGAGSETEVARRARNWAEIRPEWGLAGCRGFVVAPRSRTAAAKLDGQVFLHSYDWQQDAGFKVLELILTAPVVVASWISLQYYGSVVAPAVFGGGTKQVHNVTGGMGVLDGATGALRTGLTLQSVHDGAEFVHDPLRLTVVVEAPAEAITDILARHPAVQALFDNGWLKMLRLGADGRVAERYEPGLRWAVIAPEPRAALAAC